MVAAGTVSGATAGIAMHDTGGTPPGSSMNLRRIVNWLNPRSPRRAMPDTNAWIDSWNARPENPVGSTGRAWAEAICPGESRSVDFSTVTAATEEDYLLEVDVAKNRSMHSLPKFLFSIPGGRVLGPEGYIISPDNQLLTDLSYSFKSDEPFPVFKRRRFPRLERLKGTYAVLSYPASGNYYHWLLETLPNLKALAPHLSTLDGIFVPKLRRFHVDSLAACGVNPGKLLEITCRDFFACEHLLVQSFSSAWALQSWVPGWLKQSLVTAAAPGTGKKLYLSRSDASWRKVSNEPAVTRLLESAGYESLVLSSLTCTEQANLFGSAVSIISAHGAGLANLVFCRPGTRVLEIFPTRWTSLCYLQLSQLVGCDYRYMIAAPLGQDRQQILEDSRHIPIASRQQGVDLEIPLDKLARYLEQEVD